MFKSGSIQEINNGWTFTQLPSKNFENTKEDWLECTKFPTSVHVELLGKGKIPDPYKDLNEWDVQCQGIGEADWAFKTTFEIDSSNLKFRFADLVFEGLDTYCDVELNGNRIGSSDNMFIPHRFDAKKLLKEGKNELVLNFRSAWNEAKKEERENGGPMPLWNGDSCRLYSRKAQYNWGWDWGPVLMTVGPWRPIRLETYDYRFENIRIDTDLIGSDYKNATLKLSSETFPEQPKSSQIKISLNDEDGKLVKESTFSETSKNFELDNIEGWYPIGYGSQPLYNLKVDLLDENGDIICSHSSRIAFRHVELVQDPLIDQPGTTFLFEVNGVRVFCGGSNWIPADNFLTAIKEERYRQWVDLLVQGNQNMLRVWGGGVYEDEGLYNACDEAGILVWQDFMFGCGLYPSYESLNANIKKEAEVVVKRLRNHPSVVIFAGNNEDYQVAESLDRIDYDDKTGDFSKFPARQIYEHILPEAVERLSNIQYWRSSPYGGKTSRDQTIGDIHQWNVWHGTQEPWSNWDKLQGRFVSEFGMQGYPNIRTVQKWSDDKSQLFPQSRISANHNKADGFERRLELYLMENFRHAFDMESYVYYTQIMQAECLGAAYRLWRREWRGKGKEYVAGALVWQLNDCWPCVSWAIADYYLRPKPAYFAIKRELQPFTVGITRKDVTKKKDDITEAFAEITQELEVWACNSTLNSVDATVELVSFDLEKGQVDKKSFNVTLESNQSTEVWKGDVPGQITRTTRAQIPLPIVVQARLLRPDGEVLARYSNWPEPYKYLHFPNPNLKVKVEGDEVILSSEKPVKGIILDTVDQEDEEEVSWSDQGIDLFPGDEQIITGKGLKGREVKLRYLGDGSAE